MIFSVEALVFSLYLADLAEACNSVRIEVGVERPRLKISVLKMDYGG